MKSILQKLAILLSIACLGGCMNRPTQVQMNEELKKPEVILVIEEMLRNRDKDAFTETGIIKSYEIDYSKTYHNPMGGIHVYLYINNKTELYLKCILGKNNTKYYIGSSSASKELVNLLEKNNE